MNPKLLVTSAMLGMGMLALAMAIPQLLKLHKTKHTQSFHLLTWTVWTVNQIVYVAYAISIREWIIVAIGLGWVAFYFAMLWTIVEYRKPGRGNRD